MKTRDRKILVLAIALAALGAIIQHAGATSSVPTDPLWCGHYWHTATLLPNGTVLVAGGHNDSGDTLSGAEVYDLAKGTWTATCALGTGRSGHTATLLPNGNVLVAGGTNNLSGGLSSAELYDPATWMWTEIEGLSGGQAVLLPNGKVLISGQSYAQLYDPATGTWKLTDPTRAVRGYSAATLLPNGKVLIAGGNIGGTLSSAELYDAGLGFSANEQPEIITVTSPLSLGGSLTLTGSGFRGLPGASSGNTQDSSSDHPVVQLRSLENGQSVFLHSTSWSPNSYTSAAVSGLPAGWTMATVFVNGIPSTARILLLDTTPIPGTILLSQATRLPSGALQFSFTNTPGSSFSVWAATNPSMPLSSWTALGGVTEISPGQFQFSDLQATNYPRRFYRVSSP